MKIVWAGRNERIAHIDLTGGEATAGKLDDNRTPKVLLRFSQNGVFVDVALDLKAARSFGADFAESLAWVEAGGVEP